VISSAYAFGTDAQVTMEMVRSASAMRLFGMVTMPLGSTVAADSGSPCSKCDGLRTGAAHQLPVSSPHGCAYDQKLVAPAMILPQEL